MITILEKTFITPSQDVTVDEDGVETVVITGIPVWYVIIQDDDNGLSRGGVYVECSEDATEEELLAKVR